MFILVMGVTGCGKTTIGRLLSVRLGWPFYDADDFHSAENVRKMASGIPLTDDDRHPWLDRLHQLISDREARRENGVLACSALKNTYRAILTADADVKIVYLKAHPDLIRARLDARSGHYMSKLLIQSQFDDLEEPAEGIIVDAGCSPEQIVAAICAEIKT